ncbi:VWA domain-containing protein [Acidicapsa ligni]|uniref:VWA domain-containing protein n=1 Tax=Acidicapsa ligni TaxID=542300 RepID=UPI0021E0640F|nr:VWA domain-containing protein [Acidicapsa ligni]
MRLLNMRRNWLGAVALMCLLGGSATSGLAQLAPSPDEAPVSNAPAPKEDENQPVATLKANVNLVSLYFTVKDKNGALIPHLSKDDCTVEEDKTPQKLKNFQAEVNQPLTLGILLDTSGSQQHVLPLEKDSGSQFLSRVLKSKDEAFLIGFDVDVDLLQDYTNSPHLLERAMDKAEINTAGGNGSAGIPGIGQGPVPTQGAPKGTLLYDAVYLSSNEKLSRETGRKAIIILTDGEDQGSKVKLAGAIEAAQKANVIVYVIMIADRGFYGGFGFNGDSAMKKMAEETGGRMIDVGNNGKKLETAFQQIEDELRTQYVASYTPTNEKVDGSYRKIAVACKGDNLKIQVRKGYYALAPE